MELFVEQDSIVRKIWGRRDSILFIFAGASAEFALNKAVDWLYFTGRLPADPLGRLFSTVAYARMIVFSDKETSHQVIDRMRMIHNAVEENRNSKIPDWAYRDVLYMLVHYSIASFELLERKLTSSEKEEIYNVFYRVGARMGLTELPENFIAWLNSREQHLTNDLQKSLYTEDLFKQYKKHLGAFRFWLLVESQKLVVPQLVGKMLAFKNFSFFTPFIPVYKLSKRLKLDWYLMSILLPGNYREQVKQLST